MKAVFSLIVLAALITLAATLVSPSLPLTAVLEAPLDRRLPENYQAMLSVEFQVPTRLPGKIKDPFLLSAWVYLYNQTGPIRVQGSRILSGRSLAEYVLQNNIQVSWGTAEICRGNSCSRRPVCLDDACVEYYIRRRKLNPIFIAQRYHQESPDGLVELAGSLAHEVYHHQWYFGPVATNLFEEYWAYYVGSQVRRDGWGEFGSYDPYNAACLKSWFEDLSVLGYYTVDTYPFTLKAAVDWDSPCDTGKK